VEIGRNRHGGGIAATQTRRRQFQQRAK